MSDNQLFKPEERIELQRVLSKMNREQLLWLGGYISAAIDFAPAVHASYANPVIEPKVLTHLEEESSGGVSSPQSLTILFGSHSGNSEKVAQIARKEAQRLGLEAKVRNMEDYNPRSLKDEEQLLVIVSTHGEGEPPLAAQELYEKLKSGRGFSAENIRYLVIALGDSTYKHFCKTGHDFFEFLKKLGASPLRDVVELDTDFNTRLSGLIPEVVGQFATVNAAQSAQSSRPAAAKDVEVDIQDGPVEVEIIEKIQLNGRGADKETWHIELVAEHPALKYQPGDAIEVFTENDPSLVAAVLDTVGLDGRELVDIDGARMSLKEALQYHSELTVLTAPVVKKYSTFLQNETFNRLLEDPEQLSAFLAGTDVLDLLQKYPAELKAVDLVSTLRRLAPRAYSIASSPEEVGNEIHITVGAVRYEKEGRRRNGVCSTFLADRVDVGQRLKVKIRSNNQFRLPEDDNTSVIMVGAGTGIAPYRGFLQQRAALGHKGRNWLIFGDRHFTTDFLYQTEWLKYRNSGLLTRLDVAFSRDQEQKIYVQHKMKQNAGELYKWISEGGRFYVCGDMKTMAVDVRNTFLSILQAEGGMSPEQSLEYFNKLRKERRYQEDVY